jgi:hypothetical protein
MGAAVPGIFTVATVVVVMALEAMGSLTDFTPLGNTVTVSSVLPLSGCALRAASGKNIIDAITIALICMFNLRFYTWSIHATLCNGGSKILK